MPVSFPSSRRLTSEPGFVFMEVLGFVVNKVTVRQVFLGALRLSVPHIHILFICHRRRVILPIDSVIKQNLFTYVLLMRTTCSATLTLFYLIIALFL